MEIQGKYVYRYWYSTRLYCGAGVKFKCTDSYFRQTYTSYWGGRWEILEISVVTLQRI